MRWRALMAAAMLAVAAQASAQHAGRAPGFTWAVGGAKAWLGSTCNACESTSTIDDLGGVLRAGWRYNEKWIFNFEALLWQNSYINQEVTNKNDYDNYSIIATYYPRKHFEYFLRGGVGLTSVSVLMVPSGSTLSSQFKATPFTGTLGAGIDFNIGRSWSLSPYVDFQYSPSAKATADGADTGLKLSATMFVLGIAITVH